MSLEYSRIIELYNYSSAKTEIINTNEFLVPYCREFIIKTYFVKNDLDYLTKPKLFTYYPQYVSLLCNLFKESKDRLEVCLRGLPKLLPFTYRFSINLKANMHEEQAKRIIYLRRIISVFNVYDKIKKRVKKRKNETVIKTNDNFDKENNNKQIFINEKTKKISDNISSESSKSSDISEISNSRSSKVCKNSSSDHESSESNDQSKISKSCDSDSVSQIYIGKIQKNTNEPKINKEDIDDIEISNEDLIGSDTGSVNHFETMLNDKDVRKEYKNFIKSINKQMQEKGLKEKIFDSEFWVYFVKKPKGEEVYISYIEEFDSWIVGVFNIGFTFKDKNDFELFYLEDKAKLEIIIEICNYWLNLVHTNFNPDIAYLFKKSLSNKTLMGYYVNETANDLYRYKKQAILFYSIAWNNLGDKLTNYTEQDEALGYSEKNIKIFWGLECRYIIDVDQAYYFFISHGLHYCPLIKHPLTLTNFSKLMSLIDHYQNMIYFGQFVEVEDGFLVYIYKLNYKRTLYNIQQNRLKWMKVIINQYKIKDSNLKNQDKIEFMIEKMKKSEEKINTSKILVSILFLKSRITNILDKYSAYLLEFFGDLRRILKQDPNIGKEYYSYAEMFIKNQTDLNSKKIYKDIFYMNLIVTTFKFIFDKISSKNYKYRKIRLYLASNYKKLKDINSLKNHIIKNLTKKDLSNNELIEKYARMTGFTKREITDMILNKDKYKEIKNDINNNKIKVKQKQKYENKETLYIIHSLTSKIMDEEIFLDNMDEDFDVLEARRNNFNDYTDNNEEDINENQIIDEFNYFNKANNKYSEVDVLINRIKTVREKEKDCIIQEQNKKILIKEHDENADFKYIDNNSSILEDGDDNRIVESIVRKEEESLNKPSLHHRKFSSFDIKDIKITPSKFLTSKNKINNDCFDNKKSIKEINFSNILIQKDNIVKEEEKINNGHIFMSNKLNKEVNIKYDKENIITTTALNTSNNDLIKITDKPMYKEDYEAYPSEKKFKNFLQNTNRETIENDEDYNDCLKGIKRNYYKSEFNIKPNIRLEEINNLTENSEILLLQDNQNKINTHTHENIKDNLIYSKSHKNLQDNLRNNPLYSKSNIDLFEYFGNYVKKNKNSVIKTYKRKKNLESQNKLNKHSVKWKDDLIEEIPIRSYKYYNKTGKLSKHWIIEDSLDKVKESFKCFKLISCSKKNKKRYSKKNK